MLVKTGGKKKDHSADNKKMKSNYDYEIIHDYLQGVLDRKTGQAIAELISQDETARSIAEGIVQMEKEFKGNEAIDTYLENFRLKQLNVVHQQTKPAAITKKRWLRIAATLLLLISVGSLIRLLISQPDFQEIVNLELAQPYPLSNVVRGERSGTPSEKAFQLYSQGEFDIASNYFDLAMADEKKNASIVFYNALCHLYQGHYDKANALFHSEIVSESRYSQQAEWFRALSFLKLENNMRAIEILTVISKDPRHFKHVEAESLLNQLD